MRRLLCLLLATSSACASERAFSIHDDVLAYPQYEVVFSESYILEADAVKRLDESRQVPEAQTEDHLQSELAGYRSTDTEDDYTDDSESGKTHERLLLRGRPFLCSLPRSNDGQGDEKHGSTSQADQEKDLATAVNRGWELLRDLEGKCMFFVSGWWSYSFCYSSQIKQFHQLPPGSGGQIYPPQEDPSTPAYVLGRFSESKIDQREREMKSSATTQVQTKGETRYLVQKLDGGTTCDLTGKDRRVEVQFHCHPQSTDRIGWIKEVATCAYLMIIYTPRLCNDVAFLPPRQNKAQLIACREILKPDEVAEWDKLNSAEAAGDLISQVAEAPLMAGNVEIGAMKEVGKEGRRIQKGKVVSPPEEKVETVAMQQNGKLQRLSKEDLRKLNLNPETVEAFRKEIQELAGNKDWKVEKIDDDRGVTQLRGVVAGENEGKEGDESMDDKDAQSKEGSDESYKEDV